MASTPGAWAVGALCLCVLILCASLGFACIERPGIAWGKRVVRRHAPAQARRDLPRPAEPVAATRTSGA